MIRQTAAVVVALCLSTSPLYAQDTVTLTVTEASANVRKSPSVASPAIGTASRGTALIVTREVGDWVKVAWPSSPDGAGYVRVDMGTLARGNAAAAAAAKATASNNPSPVGSKAAVTPTPAPTPIAARSAQVPVSRPSAPSPASSVYVAPTHIFGVGAVAGGSTMGFGGSARGWKKDRIGVQLEVSRYSFDSADLLSRATTTDIAPALLFALNDHVTDYLWVRPYVGAALHFGRSSRTDLIFADVTESANTLGARVFFGGEMSLSSLPQFAVSADVGYYKLPDPFVGFEPGGLGFSISGHWYVK
jgi:Bacterial SH3 domain